MNRQDGSETDTRFLIVNADDFGLTDGINRGILQAHKEGIVTSASMMVRYPSAKGAATYARAHPELSVGLHFDLAEWRYRNGEWRQSYQVIDARDSGQVRREFEKQLCEFQRLIEGPPTHLDSHQHIHIAEPARSILLEYSAQLRVPLRSCSALISYRGDFYGQTAEGAPLPKGISLSNLGTIIEASPLGWTELGCHPGYADELASVYSSDREKELLVLCSQETRQLLDLHGIQLRSFHDLERREN